MRAVVVALAFALNARTQSEHLHARVSLHDRPGHCGTLGDGATGFGVSDLSMGQSPDPRLALRVNSANPVT